MNDDLEQSLIRNENLSTIAKEGYYLDQSILCHFETGWLNDILINWNSGNESLLIKELKLILSQNHNQLKKDCLDSLQDRGIIVEKIFDLYTQENYIALCPLVLAQVDGIMKIITKGEYGFYNANHENKRENPNRIKYLESDFFLDFFSQYEFLNVENRNEFQLFEKNITDMTKFNRHSILHGESFEYGTEINGIKALLLFIFVSAINQANK
jgi:hypothetical protein